MIGCLSALVALVVSVGSSLILGNIDGCFSTKLGFFSAWGVASYIGTIYFIVLCLCISAFDKVSDRRRKKKERKREGEEYKRIVRETIEKSGKDTNK